MPAWRPVLAEASRVLANSTTLTLQDRREVILDRGVNVGDVEGDREAARKSIKIAHVDLALARNFRLHFQLRRQMAGDHGDEDKKNRD